MAKAKKRTATTVTPTTTTEDIKLSDIKAEDEIQQRINTSSSTVEDYTEMIKGGFKFPPLIVYRDPDGDNLLADGFHRFKAYEKAKKESAPCEVREGSRSDAMLFAATDAVGLVYLASAAALGAVFVMMAWKLKRDQTIRKAKQLYLYSLLYLALLFAVMLADSVYRF